MFLGLLCAVLVGSCSKLWSVKDLCRPRKFFSLATLSSLSSLYALVHCHVGTCLGHLVPVRGNLNAASYKDILYNCVLLTCLSKFDKGPHLFDNQVSTNLYIICKLVYTSLRYCWWRITYLQIFDVHSFSHLDILLPSISIFYCSGVTLAQGRRIHPRWDTSPLEGTMHIGNPPTCMFLDKERKPHNQEEPQAITCRNGETLHRQNPKLRIKAVPCRFEVAQLNLILSSPYCLWGVLDVLLMHTWASSWHASFFPPPKTCWKLTCPKVWMSVWMACARFPAVGWHSIQGLFPPSCWGFQE